MREKLTKSDVEKFRQRLITGSWLVRPECLEAVKEARAQEI